MKYLFKTKCLSTCRRFYLIQLNYCALLKDIILKQIKQYLLFTQEIPKKGNGKEVGIRAQIIDYRINELKFFEHSIFVSRKYVKSVNGLYGLYPL